MTNLQPTSPLQSGVAIVEKSGGPTAAFQRLINGLIPNDQLTFRTATAAAAAAAAAQPGSADLDAIDALTGTGLAARIADDTWALRTLQAGVGISITNPAGVAGNPVITATGSAVPAVAFDGGNAATGGRGFVLDGGASARSDLDYWIEGGTA